MNIKNLSIQRIFIFQLPIILLIVFVSHLTLSFFPEKTKTNIVYNVSRIETTKTELKSQTTELDDNYDFESKTIKLDDKVLALTNLLRKYKTPIASPKYAKIIIETSEENNADYRLNVGIMMAESGMCRKPVKTYNCYGYLDKVQYDSFEDGLESVTRKVSQQYTSKFGWNTTSMGDAYGVHNISSWENRLKAAAYNLPE